MAPDGLSRKRQRDKSPDSPRSNDRISGETTLDRACDACKLRRVKCDRTVPCANCRRRGDTCHISGTVVAEPRPRSTFTKEHEQKLDSMGDQLARIEGLLWQQQATIASLTNRTLPGASSSDQAASSAEDYTPGLPSPESQAAHHEGDATTQTHSTTAHKLVENAVQGSPSAYYDTELVAAVNSLKDMAGKMTDGLDHLELSTSSWRPMHIGSQAIDPPTAQELDRILDEAVGSISLGFTPGLTIDVLRDKCTSVFRPGASAEAVRQIYVYGTLRNLAVEFGGQHEDTLFARRCKDLSAYFSIQLGHAVDELRFLVPATAEAASAFTIASGAAMELCRPVVAQSLAAKAASIVLSLGYNRLSTMRMDSEHARQIKIFTFWMAYWLDTSFSVRLGRAPIIRSHDVAVPQLSENSIIPEGWAVAFNYSTRISGLQCKVVEQLYTPFAVEMSLDGRKQRAQQLIEELDRAWNARGLGPTSIGLWKDSDAVMHHSTVCLVQHATMPAASSQSPALESARHALRLNVEAWGRHKHLPDFIWAGHCHWTLLKGPITPFIVTFCHIIAHPLMAHDDLRLLGEFVSTMAHLRRFSDGMIKLHKLCDVFAKVASLYVQAKSRELASDAGSHDNPIGGLMAADDPATAWLGQPAVDDIDTYLSSMGLAPPAMPNSHTSQSLDDMAFDPNFLMDWYQGNNSLMGFLEQDLAFDNLAGDNW